MFCGDWELEMKVNEKVLLGDDHFEFGSAAESD